MSNPIPSQLALTLIQNGTLEDATPVANNYSAIEAAVNALVTALSGGSSGQFLKAVDTSDVVWEAALSLASVAAQATSGQVSLKLSAFGKGANLAIASGAIGAPTSTFHAISTNDGSTVNTISTASLDTTQGVFLIFYNATGTIVTFGAGGNVANEFTIPAGGYGLLFWNPSIPKWVALAAPGSSPLRGTKVNLTYGATVTPDAPKGEVQSVTVTDGTAFTIANPTNPPGSGETQDLFIEIFNSSGGAHGAISFGAAFVEITNITGGTIANGKKSMIHYRWNGSVWVGIANTPTGY